MALDIQPVEGMVALQILNDPGAPADDDDSSGMMSAPVSPDNYNTALTALVIGIGPKGPAGVKKGSVVLCRGYARNGLDVGDDVVLTDSYCIAGIVK
jgi:hypothetical protein